MMAAISEPQYRVSPGRVYFIRHPQFRIIARLLIEGRKVVGPEEVTGLFAFPLMLAAFLVLFYVVDGQIPGLPAADNSVGKAMPTFYAVMAWLWPYLEVIQLLLFLSGLLACLGTLAVILRILLGVRRAGREALERPEALFDLFQPWADRLFSLTRSGYISLLIAALLCFLEVCLIIAVNATSDSNTFLFAFGMIFVTLIFLVAWRLIKDLTGGNWGSDSAGSKPFSLTGLPLTEEQAPELWQFIRSTAAKAGAAVPEHLVMGLGGQLTLVRDQVRLTSGDTLPPGNLLYLPLTVLAYLPKAEAEAMIAAALFDLTPAENEFGAEFRAIFKQLGQIIRAGEICMANIHLGEDKPEAMAINLVPAAYFLQTFIKTAR